MLSEEDIKALTDHRLKLHMLRRTQEEISGRMSEEEAAIREIVKKCKHENAYCSSPSFAGGPDGYTCWDCGTQFDR